MVNPGTIENNFLGVGPEWSRSLNRDIAGKLDELSCLEVIPENFINTYAFDGFLKELSDSRLPVIIHGVGLSLGSDEPFKQAHLNRVLRIADEVNAVMFSEHLAMTESGGVELDHLVPLRWSVHLADQICRKIEKIQKQTKLPVAVEHVAHRFFFRDCELTEPAFINRILERTGAKLVLDLHNLYVNSQNAGFDPVEWMSEIAISETGLIHLAGGFRNSLGFLIDGHSEAVPDPVWSLFDYAIGRTSPLAVIVERTENYPGYDAIQGELSAAKRRIAGAA